MINLSSNYRTHCIHYCLNKRTTYSLRNYTKLFHVLYLSDVMELNNEHVATCSVHWSLLSKTMPSTLITFFINLPLISMTKGGSHLHERSIDQSSTRLQPFLTLWAMKKSFQVLFSFSTLILINCQEIVIKKFQIVLYVDG